MSMHDEVLIRTLQKFGFNQYEARTYSALIGLGKVIPNTVSKASGVPRARIYDILESLRERGLVLKETDGEGTKTYSALPVQSFLDQAENTWHKDFAYVEKILKEAESPRSMQDHSIAVLSGKDSILAFSQNLIDQAETKVICSLSARMYDGLAPQLNAAAERNCRLAGIVFGVDSQVPGIETHSDGEGHLSLGKRNWFIVSVDNKRLLYGSLVDDEGEAFFTDDVTHVFFLEDYIYHDMMLNRIEQSDSPKIREARWSLANNLLQLFSYGEN